MIINSINVRLMNLTDEVMFRVDRSSFHEFLFKIAIVSYNEMTSHEEFCEMSGRLLLKETCRSV